jgi:hypothetical protein
MIWHAIRGKSGGAACLRRHAPSRSRSRRSQT